MQDQEFIQRHNAAPVTRMTLISFVVEFADLFTALLPCQREFSSICTFDIPPTAGIANNGTNTNHIPKAVRVMVQSCTPERTVAPNIMVETIPYKQEIDVQLHESMTYQMERQAQVAGSDALTLPLPNKLDHSVFVQKVEDWQPFRHHKNVQFSLLTRPLFNFLRQEAEVGSTDQIQFIFYCWRPSQSVMGGVGATPMTTTTAASTSSSSSIHTGSNRVQMYSATVLHIPGCARNHTCIQSRISHLQFSYDTVLNPQHFQRLWQTWQTELQRENEDDILEEKHLVKPIKQTKKATKKRKLEEALKATAAAATAAVLSAVNQHETNHMSRATTTSSAPPRPTSTLTPLPPPAPPLITTKGKHIRIPKVRPITFFARPIVDPVTFFDCRHKRVSELAVMELHLFSAELHRIVLELATAGDLLHIYAPHPGELYFNTDGEAGVKLMAFEEPSWAALPCFNLPRHVSSCSASLPSIHMQRWQDPIEFVNWIRAKKGKSCSTSVTIPPWVVCPNPFVMNEDDLDYEEHEQSATHALTLWQQEWDKVKAASITTNTMMMMDSKTGPKRSSSEISSSIGVTKTSSSSSSSKTSKSSKKTKKKRRKRRRRRRRNR